MFKKVFLLTIIALLSFSTVACQNTTTTVATTASTTASSVALPDLTGLSQAEITSTLDNLGLTPKFYFDVSVSYESDDEYDKFVMYGSDLTAGDLVPAGSEVRVYTTPLNLEPIYYNDLAAYDSSLQLETSDYTGQEFIADGIGEVTVEKFVDGDTTFFRSGSQTFSVRYLGIDTPESTALYEPWGKAAANYTKDRLSTAETIVLQAEGERMDGNGRYLAWVWYIPQGESTFILLNLELVELAYSKDKVAAGSIYANVLLQADWNASLTKRRVWGELDPHYDYSLDGTQMSIQYLMENFSDFVGLKVVITGEIVRKIGNGIFIQDENGYGVYMYMGYTTDAQLQVGVNVTISALVPTYYSGSPQLSSYYRTNLMVNDDDFIVDPAVVTYDDFTFALLGSLVTMEDLEVTSISYAATSASESIYVEDSLGNTFVVRIDDATGLDSASLGITVGSIITVTGPLSYYDYDYNNDPDTYTWLPSNFQLMISTSDDVTIE
ncbi:MAG: thermonuclease family protein [Bacilli bacterium]|nr:thermonuclease family protein [Bacilli bacterium]